jgi:hypothetical protein
VTARADSDPAATPTFSQPVAARAFPTEQEPAELSMRILEFALALGALATAILLGLPR